MSTHASEKSRATWPRILRSRTRRIVALTTGLVLVSAVASALYVTHAPITGTVTPGNPQNIAWFNGGTTSGTCVVTVTQGSGVGTSLANTGNLDVAWSQVKPGDVCIGHADISTQSNVTTDLKVSDFTMTGLPAGITLAVPSSTFGTVIPLGGNASSATVTFRLTADDTLVMGSGAATVTGQISAVAATDFTGYTGVTPTY